MLCVCFARCAHISGLAGVIDNTEDIRGICVQVKFLIVVFCLVLSALYLEPSHLAGPSLGISRASAQPPPQSALYEDFIAREQAGAASELPGIGDYREQTLRAAQMTPVPAIAAVLAMRWYETGEPYNAPATAREFVEVTRYILDRPAVQRLFSFSNYESLPQLQGQLLAALCHNYWVLGEENAARKSFQQLLDLNDPALEALITSTEEGSTWFDEIGATAVATIDEDWSNLSRGERAYHLRNYREAERFLRRAFASDNPEVVARAGILLSDTVRLSAARETDVSELQYDILSTTLENASSPILARRALLERAQACRRARPGCFLSDIKSAAYDYPRGPYTDVALYKLAQHFASQDELDKSLALFDELRELAGENNFRDSSVYVPALLLYRRNGPDDMARARSLFEQYLATGQEPIVLQLARFWLGRVLEEQGDSATADEHFAALFEAYPYSYYGIRAAMHLQEGSDASSLFLADENIYSADMPTFTAPARPGCRFGDAMPDLQMAIESGLYARVLKAYNAAILRREFLRPSNVAWPELASSASFADIVVLMSLRQDIVAATDAMGEADDVIECANAALLSGDLRVAADLATGQFTPEFSPQSLMAVPGFLAATRPDKLAMLHGDTVVSDRLSPDFYYAIAKMESSLFPYAVSPLEAIGLFQFMDTAIQNLVDDELLEDEPFVQRIPQLMEEVSSYAIARKWFEQLLWNEAVAYSQKFDHPNEVLPLLLATSHSAGRGTMRRSVRAWTSTCCADDIEMLIETAPYGATRHYLRGLVTEMTLVEASGYFEPKENPGEDDPGFAEPVVGSAQ